MHLQAAATAPDWISAIATAVAVVFAFFAWLAARRTTTAQTAANAQQAEALRIQGAMLQQAQESITEQRHQRMAAARSRASKLKVTQGSAAALIAWAGSDEPIKAGGEPILCLENESDQPFHSVFVSFLDPDSNDVMDGKKHWAEVLTPRQKWQIPIPASSGMWYVEFMDVDDYSWQLNEQFPLARLATGAVDTDRAPSPGTA